MLHTVYKIHLLLNTIGLAQFAGNIPCHAQCFGLSGIVVFGIQDKARFLGGVWKGNWRGCRGRDWGKVVDVCRCRLWTWFVVFGMTSTSRLYCCGTTQGVKHEQRKHDCEQAAAKRNGGQPSAASRTIRPSIHDGQVVAVSDAGDSGSAVGVDYLARRASKGWAPIRPAVGQGLSSGKRSKLSARARVGSRKRNNGGESQQGAIEVGQSKCGLDGLWLAAGNR